MGRLLRADDALLVEVRAADRGHVGRGGGEVGLELGRGIVIASIDILRTAIVSTGRVEEEGSEVPS